MLLLLWGKQLMVMRRAKVVTIILLLLLLWLVMIVGVVIIITVLLLLMVVGVMGVVIVVVIHFGEEFYFEVLLENTDARKGLKKKNVNKTRERVTAVSVHRRRNKAVQKNGTFMLHESCKGFVYSHDLREFLGVFGSS